MQAELKNFASAIDRAKAMWDMSQAAQQMNKLAGRQASDTFEQIKTDVAVDSVMRSVNKAFSEMETSLMDNPEVKQAQQQAVMNAPHAPGNRRDDPRATAVETTITSCRLATMKNFLAPSHFWSCSSAYGSCIRAACRR